MHYNLIKITSFIDQIFLLSQLLLRDFQLTLQFIFLERILHGILAFLHLNVRHHLVLVLFDAPRAIAWDIVLGGLIIHHSRT